VEKIYWNILFLTYEGGWTTSKLYKKVTKKSKPIVIRLKITLQRSMSEAQKCMSDYKLKMLKTVAIRPPVS